MTQTEYEQLRDVIKERDELLKMIEELKQELAEARRYLRNEIYTSKES